VGNGGKIFTVVDLAFQFQLFAADAPWIRKSHIFVAETIFL
jgi:hypothetical protein